MSPKKRTRRSRDFQRSLVYGWERAAAALEGRDLYQPVCVSLADVQERAAPIWRAERGRYGKAKAQMPGINRPAWGQRRGLAKNGSYEITLPRWARSPWMVLHELAHFLDPKGGHGPRFVGILIGLVCRHLDQDANQLMRLADAAGVKYGVRSIGTVPVRGPQWRALKALAAEGPMTSTALACWLSIGMYGPTVTPTQIRGAMLQPLGHRQGAPAARTLRPGVGSHSALTMRCACQEHPHGGGGPGQVGFQRSAWRLSDEVEGVGRSFGAVSLDRCGVHGGRIDGLLGLAGEAHELVLADHAKEAAVGDHLVDATKKATTGVTTVGLAGERRARRSGDIPQSVGAQGGRYVLTAHVISSRSGESEAIVRLRDMAPPLPTREFRCFIRPPPKGGRRTRSPAWLDLKMPDHTHS